MSAMNDTTWIYVLKDPRDMSVFYVGKSDTPAMRIIHHINESRRSDRNSKRNRRIRAICSAGFKPIMQPIQQVPRDEWESYEIGYIEIFTMLGACLTNGTAGGGVWPSWKGLKHRAETKELIRSKLKGRPGRKPSAEHLAKISQAARTIPRWNKGKIGAGGRSVYQYALDGRLVATHASTQDAANNCGVSQSSVVRCCNRSIHRLKDSVFLYEHHQDGIEPFVYCHNIPIVGTPVDGGEAVAFDSLKAAAAFVGIKPSGVSCALNGINGQRTAGGYIWKRVA
jgi:hypothetical protein